MIEFDVLTRPGNQQLIVAHDERAATTGTPPTLEQALAYLSSPVFAYVKLLMDLKNSGHELPAVQLLEHFSLRERTLITANDLASLDRIRHVWPDAKLGWSVPKVRKDYTDNPVLKLPALAALMGYKNVLPRLARKNIDSGRYNVIVCHWRVLTKRLVRTINQAGGEVYVWTVNDIEGIRKVSAMGVAGIITDDPRLFVT
jgi:glycerophosphoryl diester phosphodiesterase